MRKVSVWGKVRLTLLGVFAVAFMFMTYSFASYAAEGTIKAASAKIRESTSTSSAHIGSALQGEKYKVTGMESGADGYTWYKVTFEENKTGYIRADLITVSGEIPAAAPATYNPTVAVTELTPVSAIVTGSSVRVRPDAAASGGVVSSVVRDTVLTIDGMATGSDGKIWYRVNCTVSGVAVLGFVREDFVSVQGELTPPGQVLPQDPVIPEVPQEPVPSEPVPTETPKAYDTVYENDKWYLLNNEKNEKYVIGDLFSAVQTNKEIAEQFEKTAKSQKGYIVTLVILLLVALGAVAFLVWKLKDLLDEAYFKQVEKKSLRERENRPKRVMQTVGEERKQGVAQPLRRPAQGQPQRSSQGQSQRNGQGQQQRGGQRPAGEGVRRPAGQTRPNGEAPRKPVNRPEGVPSVGKNLQRPVGEAVTRQAQAKPEANQAQPVAKSMPEQNAVKPQGFQPKNFMADDDEFEFEFLNWDGDEEE